MSVGSGRPFDPEPGSVSRWRCGRLVCKSISVGELLRNYQPCADSQKAINYFLSYHLNACNSVVRLRFSPFRSAQTCRDRSTHGRLFGSGMVCRNAKFFPKPQKWSLLVTTLKMVVHFFVDLRG